MGRQAKLVTRLLPWAVLLLLPGCATETPPVVGRRSATLVSPGLSPIRTVVVDAGHGGKDPGASYYGLREKDLTLDISRRLRDELTSAGLSVVLTRDHDEFIALTRRPSVANRLPADLFVSIHINANRKRHVSGIEVYYPRESVIAASSSLPPGVQPADVALSTTTVRHILWDLALSQSRRDASAVASRICRAMQTRLSVRCRGTRGARFVVLRQAWVPAVLVEVGYLSNRREASQLATPAYRQTIAKAIAEGVAAYAREL